MARAQADSKASQATKARRPAKSIPQSLYETATRTSSAQWDALLRHPFFLRPVSLYINGVLTLLERTRMLVGFGLRLINVPTREEIVALDRKLDALGEQVETLTAQLAADELAARAPKRMPRRASPAAARGSAAKRAASVRRRSSRAAAVDSSKVDSSKETASAADAPPAS
ncbi:MAG: hypothetical protein SNJ62_13195 [Chloracidobacterium sp.]|uniref:Uncharacterized protein n=1 Tax=Chloracidobacterium validum TaxID=2821543 RepID=A0ABX8BEJ0_9BACT|nr:hypothetical protein [Chloracidobacterium validum]QUW04079.1 hypothetical protein J8C06_13580 [Chloracidobacterium validum]